MSSQKAKMFVIPAKAGIHNHLKKMGSCFRRDDEHPIFSTFCEAILVGRSFSTGW